MALLTFVNSDDNKTKKKPPPQPQQSKRRTKQEKRQQTNKETNDKTRSSSSSSSWDQFKNLLTCKQIEPSSVHDPASARNGGVQGYSKLGSSCGSICSFRDVVHGNTRVVHRADNSPESSSVGQEPGLVSRKAASSGSTARSARSNGGGAYTSSSTSRGMQFRKLSGCYECHMIVDPSRYPITPRSTICACPQCGEVFPKIESLELHQAVRHAVSELGPEDSGRNIVEIIFKSSWLKKDSPIFKIERILKVHNTQRTIQRFEDCRDAVKSRHAHGGARKNPRCAADGNELLRFHCTTLACSLGARGSTSLCAASASACGVCAIIRHGFQGGAGDSAKAGVWTTASSGRAHDSLTCSSDDHHDHHGRRAMIVCRVIAGRVRRVAAAEDAAAGDEESATLGGACAGAYDSVAGCTGIYSNLEELVVFNPRAILPCFVVIYKALESQ